MASIILDQTTLSIPRTSGSTMIAVQYNLCEGVGASTNLPGASAQLNRAGDLVLFSWGENNSLYQRNGTITVEAVDYFGETVAASITVTQAGTGSNPTITINGLRNISGNTQDVYYSASCDVPGTFTVAINGMNPWVTVSEVVQTAANTADITLHFSENTTGQNRQVTAEVYCRFDYAPYEAIYELVITQGYITPSPGPDTGSTQSEFYYSPAAASVSYDSGSYTSPAPVMTNVRNLTITYNGTMEITTLRLDPNNGKITVTYGANNSSSGKSETFTVVASGTSGNITSVFTLYQGSFSYAVNPIWKDTDVTISTNDAFKDYKITLNGDEIYSGRAYKMPGDENLSFTLNPVVRDYIDNWFWWRGGYQTPSGWQRTFHLELSDGTTGDYVFTKDWSYNELYYNARSLICLNDPIINEVPSGAYVPICVFSPSSSGSVNFTYNPRVNNITVYTSTLDTPKQARYLFTSAPGYKYGYSGNGYNNYAVYSGVTACDAPYILYYENAYGGIDALPINGNVTATDKITSYTTKNKVKTPSVDFAYRRYVNDTTKSWELRTRWLNDLQSSKMHHLIESTMVFLYDYAEEKLIPVVIDESSLTYKTYRNQGRKFYNYTFTVKESQNRVRK